MGFRRIPWDEIKAAYTLGWEDEAGNRVYPTCRDIEKRWGISSRTLADRIKAEKWNELREQNQRAIAARAQQKTVETVGDALAEINLLSVEGALEAMQIAREGARECGKLLEELRAQDKNSVAVLCQIASASKRYCEVLSEALKTARLAAGQSTDNIAVSDWRKEIVQAVREGIVTREEVERELGPLANGLFA